MGNAEIRTPIQKRAIEKKEKIVKAGFELICEKGYYNINTAEIAKSAGVSTGIVYQYFKDKHDILIEGIRLYSNSIFYPMLSIIDCKTVNITKESLPASSSAVPSAAVWSMCGQSFSKTRALPRSSAPTASTPRRRGTI